MKKFLISIFRIISLAVIIYCSTKIYIWYKENKSNKDIQETIISNIKYVESDSIDSSEKNIDFSDLISTNPDTVGWIKVNNTNINYPIVKTSDNNYYLTHSFDKSYNSAGWVFADYRNKFDGTDKNIILYGHNRKDGSMFASLKGTLNREWYSNEENRIITLYTPKEILKYEVFSIYTITAVDFNSQTSFANSTDYINYINQLTKRSVYNFKTSFSNTEPIITLSTCASNNTYRVILHAKLISQDE